MIKYISLETLYIATNIFCPQTRVSNYRAEVSRKSLIFKKVILEVEEFLEIVWPSPLILQLKKPKPEEVK